MINFLSGEYFYTRNFWPIFSLGNLTLSFFAYTLCKIYNGNFIPRNSLSTDTLVPPGKFRYLKGYYSEYTIPSVKTLVRSTVFYSTPRLEAVSPPNSSVHPYVGDFVVYVFSVDYLDGVKKTNVQSKFMLIGPNNEF